MIFTRRIFLAGGAIASAAIPVSVRAIEVLRNQITVFDSRFARSQMFAAAGLGETVDVAQNPVNLWSALRDVPTGASVVGLTRWSEFIAIRGQLESTGLRVRHFKQQDQFVNWVMK